jgi:hypothetical protein
MSEDRHLVATFPVSRRQTVRTLRHCAIRVGPRSAPEAWSDCGNTVPRSEAPGRLTTFWAVFAHPGPDDDGVTSVLIWSLGAPAVTGLWLETQANQGCPRVCSELYLILIRFLRGFVRCLCAPRAWNGITSHWSCFCRRCAKGFAWAESKGGTLWLVCVTPGTPREWVKKCGSS